MDAPGVRTVLETCAVAKAVGMGGRQVCTDAIYDNIHDHHSVTYEDENGAKTFSNCRQESGFKNNMSCYVHVSKGRAEISERNLQIGTETTWKFEEKVKNIYQVEHDEMFAGIRTGKPLNNGEYMARSTMLPIMGRMASYTRPEITWEQAMNSKQDLSPEKYDWGSAPEVEISIPGITKFV